MKYNNTGKPGLLRLFLTAVLPLILLTSHAIAQDSNAGDIIASEETARAQIIHNAADPAAETVDIYVNGDLFVEALSFREATAFVDVPAGVALTIEIYPAGADPAGDAAYTLDGANFAAGETYTVIANGVLTDGFAPNPDGTSTAFDLFVVEGSAETAADGGVDFFIWHGATDVPAVDVWVQDGPVLVTGAAYTAHTDLISVDASPYTILIGLEGSSETGDALFEFMADLSGADGLGAAVLASGFLSPGDNQGGASLTLLVALPDGTTLVLDPEGVSTNAGTFVDQPELFQLAQNYPNPFNPTTQIAITLPESSDVTLEVFNIQGQRVATLAEGRREAGVHSVTFDASSLSSGLYLYRIQAGTFSDVRKMMLVK
ncbi:DUF4397 domain-containing protein [Balneolales bacterium ANBcel1]|nr:DUF4397 domain-containing protein [Balneolales bacterium ANBcel1]